MTTLIPKFRQPLTGAVNRPINQKLEETVSIRDFGGTGSGNETAVITAAESSSATYIDLTGLTITSTYDATTLTKNYFNGTLYAIGQGAAYGGAPNQVYVQPNSPTVDIEVQRPRTKSPLIEWAGKDVLWLGTSVPHFGAGVDGYPELFGEQLGCSVSNMSWSSSGAQYNVNGDPFVIGTVMCLSMTQDDVTAGLALYGPTSAYSDTFDPITLASQMTCDYRIKNKFSSTSYECVMLDHNVNDRVGAPGVLTPTPVTITGITKGATTTISVSSITGITVGSAVTLSVAGIPFLNYAAARVQSVLGSSFTLNINSTSYAGTFTSGSATVVNRGTIYGAWNFLINYIYNSAIIFGHPQPKIVLCGYPSNYPYNGYDTQIYSIANYLKNMAAKWDLSFFDIGFIYDVKLHDQLVYFPDSIHPSTPISRQVLSNQWVAWATGGAINKVIESNYLKKGQGPTTTNQREALYSKYIDGYGTPAYIVGTYTTVESEDFSSGAYAGWTSFGTAPTVVTAPWGTGNALYCQSTSAAPVTFIYKANTYTNADIISFDIWLDAVAGLAPDANPRTVGIARFTNVSGTINYEIQLIVTNVSVATRVAYFETNINTGLKYLSGSSIGLNANQKYNIKLEAIKATSVSSPGSLIFSIDNVQIALEADIANETNTTPASVTIGVSNSNTTQNFNIYYGNVLTQKAPLYDYSTRYTGSFTTADSKTVTVVNGIITAAV